MAQTVQSSAKKRAREGRQREAARLLLADRLTDEKIAARLGVSRRTLARWKRLPAVAGAIREGWEARVRRIERSAAPPWRRCTDAELIRELERRRRRRRERQRLRAG